MALARFGARNRGAGHDEALSARRHHMRIDYIGLSTVSTMLSILFCTSRDTYHIFTVYEVVNSWRRRCIVCRWSSKKSDVNATFVKRAHHALERIVINVATHAMVAANTPILQSMAFITRYWLSHYDIRALCWRRYAGLRYITSS